MVKDLPATAGDEGSIPGLGRSPGEGNGYPLQYVCLENSMDRGAWWSMIHGVTKSQTQMSDIHIYKDLLCSTGNSTPYSVMMYMGKDLKK